MRGACEGLTVLDFTIGLASSLLTMVLADNGAEVIKVEPPKGDPFRSLPASRMWNRGKKSIVLDLKTPAGREQAQALGRRADVVVESFRPGVADRLGIGYEALSSGNPQLVYCSITGFGRNGAYRHLKGYEGVVAAKTGRMMEFDGIANRDGPGYEAVPAGCFGAAQFALQGILAALYVRESTGKGQLVEASLLKGFTAYDPINWLNWQLHQKDPTQFPVEYLGMGVSYHYLVAPTRDGHWLQFANVMPHLFNGFLRCVGLEEAFQETVASRGRLMLGEIDEGFWELLLLRIQEKPLAEWMEIFLREENVAVEVLRSTQQGMAHPQVLHNGDVIDLEDPEVGPTKQLGPIVHFAKTPARIAKAAPRLGQHTEEVLAALEGAGAGPEGFRTGPLPKHALEGVLVLDLSTFIAAPQGVSVLADLGARVIKIEALGGEAMRQAPGVAKTFQGKESLTLDLKAREGQEIIHALVRRADILVHNFRPGVVERLGIDCATLRKLNAKLIYLNAAAYGADGPYARRPAFHPIMGAICGGAIYQAGAGTPPPPGTPLGLDEAKAISARLARANEGNPDPNTALVVASALLMALYARERTGEGQELLTTMLCANAYANSDDFISYEGKPARLVPDDDLYGLSALYRLYRSQDGWVFLACASEGEWQALCRALERSATLSDAKFATEEARRAHDRELAEILGRVFRERPSKRWEDDLAKHDVACVAVPSERFSVLVHEEPWLRESGLMAEVEHPVFGKYWRHGVPVDLSLTPGVVAGMCGLGEHTRPILEEIGYDEKRMEDLKDRGAVTWP